MESNLQLPTDPNLFYHYSRSSNRASIQKDGLKVMQQEHPEVSHEVGIYVVATLNEAEELSYYFTLHYEVPVDIWEVRVPEGVGLNADEAGDMEDFESYYITESVPPENLKLVKTDLTYGQLIHKFGSDHPSVKCQLDIVDAHRGELFGKVEAFIEDKCVGFVQFSESSNPYAEGLQDGDEVPNEVWIKYVFVEPEYRRQGVGTAMYKKISEEFPGEKVISSGTTDEGGAFRKKMLERKVITAGEESANKPLITLDMDTLRRYAENLVGQFPDLVDGVYLMGSMAAVGKGHDVDLLYDLGTQNIDKDNYEEEIFALMERTGIDWSAYDTFIAVDGRYFHLAWGAGPGIIENNEYAQEQASKPKIKLAVAAENRDQRSLFAKQASSEQWNRIKQDFLSGIVYHGTTLKIAEIVVRDGFRGLEFDLIVQDVLDKYGITKDSLDQTVIDLINYEERSYKAEHHLVSTSPSGEVATRWAGSGGEVPKKIELYIRKADRGGVKDSRLNGEPAIIMAKIKNFEATEHYQRAQQWITGHERLIAEGFNTGRQYSFDEAAQDLWESYSNFLCQPDELEVLRVIHGAGIELLKRGPLPEGKISNKSTIIGKPDPELLASLRFEHHIQSERDYRTEGIVLAIDDQGEAGRLPYVIQKGNIDIGTYDVRRGLKHRGVLAAMIKKLSQELGRKIYTDDRMRIALRHDSGLEWAKYIIAAAEAKLSECACTMVPVPKELAWKIQTLAKKVISKDDIAGDGYDIESHITLKYGVKENEDSLIEAVHSLSPFEVKLGKTHVFEPSKSSNGSAPVVVEVDAPELSKLRETVDAAIGDRPDDFDYHPHMTLAYVKPETVAKYEGLDFFDGIGFEAESIMLSKKDHVQITIPFGKAKTARSRAEDPSSLTLSALIDNFPPVVVIRWPKGMRWRELLKIVKQIVAEVAGQKVPWNDIKIWESIWGSYLEQEEQFPQLAAKGTQVVYDIAEDGTYKSVGKAFTPPVIPPKPKGRWVSKTTWSCSNQECPSYEKYPKGIPAKIAENMPLVYFENKGVTCTFCNKGYISGWQTEKFREDKPKQGAAKEKIKNIMMDSPLFGGIEGPEQPQVRAWECPCGNKGSVWSTFREVGNLRFGKSKYAMCNLCGRVFNKNSFNVIGIAEKNMFNDMQFFPNKKAERIKQRNGYWDCPCGNTHNKPDYNGMYWSDEQGEPFEGTLSTASGACITCQQCGRVFHHDTGKVIRQINLGQKNLFASNKVKSYYYAPLPIGPDGESPTKIKGYECSCGNKGGTINGGFTRCLDKDRKPTKFIHCNKCMLVFHKNTLNVIGIFRQTMFKDKDEDGYDRPAEFKFVPVNKKTGAEKIKGTPYIRNEKYAWTTFLNDLDWVCICGNTGDADGYGFSPCAVDGSYTLRKQWNGIHARCKECFRIIDVTTLKVTGQATRDLFGGMALHSKSSAERIKGTPKQPGVDHHWSDYSWVCVCGNRGDKPTYAGETGVGFSPCNSDGNAVFSVVMDWDQTHVRCRRCLRIIDATTMKVVGQVAKDLFGGVSLLSKSGAEKIKGNQPALQTKYGATEKITGTPQQPKEHKGLWRSDDWVCVCGNIPDHAGFHTCMADGTILKGVGWDNIHILCRQCGRVIDATTMKVVGFASQDLFGGSSLHSKSSAEKERIIEKDGVWMCPCGNELMPNGFSACDRQGNKLDALEWDHTKYALCLSCNRVFLKKTNTVVGMAQPNLFKQGAEKIERDDQNLLVCPCGNKSDFRICDRKGKLLDRVDFGLNNRYWLCAECSRIWDTNTNRIVGRLQKNLFDPKTSARIKRDEYDEWTCICGNTASDSGFYACDTEGNDVEPDDEHWDGEHYICGQCGRIFNVDTLQVKGQSVPDLFGGMSRISAEKIKQDKDGEWICVCGNQSEMTGFWPCDTEGNYVNANNYDDKNTDEWDEKHYVCGKCGRIFNIETLKVIGQASKDLFGGMSRTSAERVKNKGNYWECVCGNDSFRACTPNGAETDEEDPIHYICNQCGRIFNTETNRVTGQASKDLFGGMSRTSANRAKEKEGGGWICPCGNAQEGKFYPCKSDGTIISQNWDYKLALCYKCKRIIDLDTGKIVGQAVEDLFGGMSITSAEKIKGTPRPRIDDEYWDGGNDWKCLCGNSMYEPHKGFMYCDAQGHAGFDSETDRESTQFVVCLECGRIINQRTMKVIGIKSQNLNLFDKFSAQKIEGTPRPKTFDNYVRGDWKCICGNDGNTSRAQESFYTCDKEGEFIPKHSGEWKGHMRCSQCGRIINSTNMNVVGMALEDLWGEVSKVPEKKKPWELKSSLLKAAVEKVKGNPDKDQEYKEIGDWECPCGEVGEAFYPCREDGSDYGSVAPPGYRLVRCENCGRIIDRRTLLVKGRAHKDLWGRMTSAEKVKGMPDKHIDENDPEPTLGDWECPCGYVGEDFSPCLSTGYDVMWHDDYKKDSDCRLVRCNACGRIIDKITLRVKGQATEDLFGGITKTSAEKVKGRLNGDIECLCGYIGEDFYPCSTEGTSIYSSSEYEKDNKSRLMRCDNCGRIIDKRTMKIVGQANRDLFGEMTRTSSHKTPPLSDTTYRNPESGEETNAYAMIPERVEGVEAMPSLEELAPDMFKQAWKDPNPLLTVRADQVLLGDEFYGTSEMDRKVPVFTVDHSDRENDEWVIGSAAEGDITKAVELRFSPEEAVNIKRRHPSRIVAKKEESKPYGMWKTLKSDPFREEWDLFGKKEKAPEPKKPKVDNTPNNNLKKIIASTKITREELLQKFPDIEQDLKDVDDWMHHVRFTYSLVIEPITKFQSTIDEMLSTYDEFPKDAARTKKIERMLRAGKPQFPIFVSVPDMFIMEGRHRIVSNQLAGKETVPVVYIHPIENKKVTASHMYSVFIHKAYFPKELHPKGIGKEDFEQWKVKATSRQDAADQVWKEHGDRLKALMIPHESGLPRKISLYVGSPKAGVGGLPGRLPPILVEGGKTAASKIPIFYHGTPKKNVKQILKEGLKSTKSNSQSQAVYLAGDPYTAGNYAGMHDILNDKDFIILKIDSSKLNLNKLDADDYELPDLWEQGKFSRHIMNKYGDWKNVPWNVSLKLCGQVMYLGDIPPDAITLYQKN